MSTVTQTKRPSARAVWKAKVDALVDRGTSRSEAVRIVSKADPELRRRLVAEASSDHGRVVQERDLKDEVISNLEADEHDRAEEAFAKAVLDLVDKGHSVEEARWMAAGQYPDLVEKLELDDMGKRKGAGGNRPVPLSSDSRPSARSRFRAKVDELVAKGSPRQRAVAIVATQDPKLHRAMIDEANRR